MTKNSRYQRALDYLFSHLDHSKSHAAALAPENFDLARVRALMASLGDPHHKYPVIHIAGTKGKGSVAALCAAALQAAGYRVGLYTSPHLQAYTERFQVNRIPVSQSEFAALVEAIEPRVSPIPHLTVFEIEAALAFWHFARQRVDVSVIEVGMGGRLDATNVVAPLVSVITPISLDHVPILGTTLAEIAVEKAGIIKTGCPVVIAPQPDAAREQIVTIARQRGARLFQVGIDNQYTAIEHSLQGQRFRLRQGATNIELYLPLLGPHQMENAATAYAAVNAAREEGLHIGDQAIRQGFGSVFWPGRFELLQQQPPVVLDCAHNPASAHRLRETLDDYFPEQPVVLVIGVMQDKDVRGILEALRARVVTTIATQADHPRALAADRLAEIAAGLGLRAFSIPDVRKAVSQARKTCPPDGMVLITGSLYVVGAARGE